jgi:hypothetical protein
MSPASMLPVRAALVVSSSTARVVRFGDEGKRKAARS